MTYTQANNLRCSAFDAIDKLRACRQTGQLLMLRIQLDRAIDELGNKAKTHSPRSTDEMRWVEKGKKVAA